MVEGIAAHGNVLAFDDEYGTPDLKSRVPVTTLRDVLAENVP